MEISFSTHFLTPYCWEENAIDHSEQLERKIPNNRWKLVADVFVVEQPVSGTLSFNRFYLP